PRVRSAITWFSRTSVSRPAICHSSGAVADRRWLRSLLALLRHRERKHHGATRLGQGPGIEPLGPGTVSDGTGYVLPPVDGVGAGARVVAAAAGELPEQISAAGIERPEY